MVSDASMINGSHECLKTFTSIPLSDLSKPFEKYHVLFIFDQLRKDNLVVLLM